MHVARLVPIVVLAAVALVAAAEPAAAAVPVLHAHRGATLADGVPTTPEDTLEAFRVTARTPEVWLEMDSLVTADGVPVVVHDSTLDRTTDCTGAVVEKTAAQVAACRVDVLGVSETLVPVALGAAPVRVPLLADALALAKASGSPVNLEIKRIPGDPGYVAGDRAFAARMMAVVKAAELDPAKLIIQSFDPTNLDVAKEELPGVVTSLLTLAAANEGAPALAAARGYEWVSPGGVPTATFVQQARALGRRIVPYTLNTAAEVKAAAALGVDAIITDDLPLARRALGIAAPSPPSPPAPAVTPASRAAVTVAFRRRSPAAALRRGGVPVVLRARRAARVSLLALSDGRRLAARTVSIPAGARRTILFRLTAAGRRALAGRRSATFTVRVTVDGSTPRTKTLRLR